MVRKLRDIISARRRAESGKEQAVSPPTSFFLELTNQCNLRCTMCNFHSPAVVRRRDKGFMDPELAGRLLTEISEASIGKTWVALHGAGEPLLHKDLIGILNRAGRHRNLDLGFLTNGVLLTPEMAARLLDTPLSWIGFSIDGIDAQMFNRYRKGADYRVVRDNALHFARLSHALRPDIRIMVNMTVQDEMRADVPSFVRLWRPEVNEVCVSPCRKIGTRENPLVGDRPAADRIPCYMLSTMMVIFWDGSVGLCCEDWFNDGRMGNVSRSSVQDVWTGERFARARRLHADKRFAEVPLCADCTSWHNALPETYFDEEMQCTVTKTAWQLSYGGRPVCPRQADVRAS